MQILIVDPNEIAQEGLSKIVKDLDAKAQVKTLSNLPTCNDAIFRGADLMVIDYTCSKDVSEIESICKNNPHLRLLAITGKLHRNKLLKALQSGVHSHLLKNCGRDEIKEAIVATQAGKSFFCEQVLDIIAENAKGEKACEGVELTERELDIIKWIAKGFTNKEIADALHISTHTVNTHRKNIMAKLNLKNVASLVVYAFKEELLQE